MVEIIDDVKQKKLDRLLSLLDPDNALSKKDFEDNFKRVLELVQQILINQQNAINKLQQDHAKALGDMEYRHQGNYNDIKGQVDHVFVGNKLKEMEGGMTTRHEGMKGEMKKMMDEMMSKMQKKMDSMKDGERGVMGPPGPKGPMPTEHLEMMKKMTAEMKRIQNAISNIPRGGSMGRAKVPMPRTVDLTSSQDGQARVFNVPPDTVRIHYAISSQFPFVIASSDITKTGNQITLNDSVAPRERGQTLVVHTDALFYP